MSILIQQERIITREELDTYYTNKKITKRHKIRKYLVRLYDKIIIGLFYEKLG